MWVIPSGHFPVAFNFRDVLTSNYTTAKQEAIAVAQRNLRSLQSIAQEDIVLMARIPDYPDKREVEVSKEAWPLVCAVVQSVTISASRLPLDFSQQTAR